MSDAGGGPGWQHPGGGPGWQQGPDGQWHPAPGVVPGVVPGADADAGIVVGSLPGAVPPGGPPPAGGGYLPAGGFGPPPGGYGSAPGYGPPAVARTSGLAVASLVFSLLWIAGLGSLLAVLFGILAKRSIHRAGGALKGRGLSTAGIVLGAVGIMSATALIIVGVTVFHAATTPSEESLGSPVSISPLAYLNGVDRITVYAITPGAHAYLAVPPAGDQFVSVHMELCVTSVSTGNSSLPQATVPLASTKHAIGHFFIATPSGVYGAVDASTGEPNLFNGTSLTSGSCQTGSLTFAVPADDTPQALRYDPTIVNHYEWKVPGT